MAYFPKFFLYFAIPTVLLVMIFGIILLVKEKGLSNQQLPSEDVHRLLLMSEKMKVEAKLLRKKSSTFYNRLQVASYKPQQNGKVAIRLEKYIDNSLSAIEELRKQAIQQTGGLNESGECVGLLRRANKLRYPTQSLYGALEDIEYYYLFCIRAWRPVKPGGGLELPVAFDLFYEKNIEQKNLILILVFLDSLALELANLEYNYLSKFIKEETL